MLNQNNKILHGNSARIAPGKHVLPKFDDCAGNYHKNVRGSTSYRRLPDDTLLEKQEVDTNPL